MIETIKKCYRETQDMEQVVQEVLCYYSDEYDGGAVPVMAIARRLRIAVKSLPIDNKLMGMLLIGEDVKKKFQAKRVVLLNDRLAYEHKRFTLARELAHYLFDYDPHRVSSYSSRIYAYADDRLLTGEENRAVDFARALLLYADAFRAAYGNIQERAYAERVRYLTALFKVPEEAVRQRIEELALL